MRLLLVLLVAAAVAVASEAAAKEPAGTAKAKPSAARAKTGSGKSAGAAAAGQADAAAAAFPKFCQEWMEKLAARERDNIANIQWQPVPGGVRGAYTGYSQEHSCTTKIGTGSVPVGRVTYRETQYEKEGPTAAEAARNPPRAIEVIETTEIFQYRGGKWIY